MRIFRGVAHVHSTYSFDGTLALQDLAAVLKGRDVHFVLMSEHVESLTPEKIDCFLIDCKRYSDDSFLLIPGIEIDALNALFFDVQSVRAWEDYQDLARQLAQGGALVAVSHPVKVKGSVPAVTAALVEGVEIWNSRHDGKIAADGRIIAFWRSLQEHLNRSLAPLCGIDFHNRHDFIPLTLEVECETLDRASIMTGIRAGHYHIKLAEKTLPLDFKTGHLPFDYRVYSKLYRLLYSAVYASHRAFVRLNIRPPKMLKSVLRRIF